mgnify:FL=1
MQEGKSLIVNNKDTLGLGHIHVMEWRNCHICGEPYAKVCTTFPRSLCAYLEWWDDVRTCEHRRTVHKNCWELQCPAKEGADDLLPASPG